METNKGLIRKFYDAFAAGDKKIMIDCYHNDIVFEDPGFGVLRGTRANAMWEMLLDRSNEGTIITYSDVQADEKNGSANWVAQYTYGPKNRKVVNRISATFEFKDGLIIKHTDVFNLWKWSSQALGLPGYLLGWSPFMKNKMHSMTDKMLTAYMENKNLPTTTP